MVATPLDIDMSKFSDHSRRYGLIFEDADFPSMSKAELAVINKILRYHCTHNGVSTYVIAHGFFNSVPTKFRQLIDVMIGHKLQDDYSWKIIARRFDIPLPALAYVMKYKLREKHDNYLIDCTGHGPRLRVNLDEVIDLGTG